ncbi:hypothetical protein CCHR01_08239 [Colletotrichum chrysophilum]|uniref:Uncharacterized protein n=1 Tax=Colletotrichum chrysophilum TaxID=1836956 RepID=A0AAD9ALQ9_9PEZI|nr:hypothetical protein CCHR01_08239 [Colletotrichum chrysophilum]
MRPTANVSWASFSAQSQSLSSRAIPSNHSNLPAPYRFSALSSCLFIQPVRNRPTNLPKKKWCVYYCSFVGFCSQTRARPARGCRYELCHTVRVADVAANNPATKLTNAPARIVPSL